MRTLRFLVAGAIALSVLWACGDDDEETVTVAPTVTVSTGAITISPQGGVYSITYTVANPADDGTISCLADVDWLTDFNYSKSNTVSFTAAANEADLRSGHIAFCYSSSNGSVDEKIIVVQNAAYDPTITLSTSSITVAYDGGAYQFSYEIVNPDADGELTCSTDAEWISDFDHSDPGIIRFTVAETEDKNLRSADITVTYSYPRGSVSEVVPVVQDHIRTTIDYSGMIGTYDATADRVLSYNSNSGFVTEKQTWTVSVIENEDGGVYIKGLTPMISESYFDNSTTYATAYLNADGQFIVPSQFIDLVLYYGYYSAYTPVTGIDSEYIYYGDSESWSPDCVFTYDEVSETWTSNYGFFVAVYSYKSWYWFWGYYDAVTPSITLRKTDGVPLETLSVGKAAPTDPSPLTNFCRQQ